MKLKWVETRFDLTVPTIAYFSMFNVERNWKQNLWNMLRLKKNGVVIFTSPSLYQLHFGNIFIQTPQELWA